ncbi:L-dopachrome tautomerase-related protein [Motilibacter deserti]|uniref:Twin-arginine translocation signal domain-containing protein n=1 Tax=Motilibacter deserti TaxID=2714956 RepID=A0ABX0GVM0_9ACTN|nr:L-dopachrome tautomerase-related protein [Motilibacter deserti]NHC14959.1 twin-arginine translocation signal domain-containing protein [Motilibacter deserti]
MTQTRRGFLAAAAAGGATLAVGGRADAAPAPTLPADQPAGRLETVATFSGPMPTGVTVSALGRVFVNFPRWGDTVPATVAELRGGRAVAYPNATINRYDARPQQDRLVSVQSVVVDPLDRLWIVDTGSPKFAPTTYGGPKLVGVDLTTNRVFAKILVPQDVALPTSYLNDVRFDLRRGNGGLAFLTDSSSTGPNGIVVVELGTGRSWRRLHDHPSTKAEPGFLPLVEGRPVYSWRKGEQPKNLSLGSDGIAISADGERLFYCPLASRRLYSVSVDALADPAVSDADVAATVVDHGEKGGGSDGLESDAAGGVYLTQYEHNAIVRRSASGTFRTVVHDPRLLWPDTMSLAADGYLYVTANQLHRGPDYHGGKDLRRKPYVLFRTKVDAAPVRLRP